MTSPDDELTRLRERLWPNHNFGPMAFIEIAEFVETERQCDAEIIRGLREENGRLTRVLERAEKDRDRAEDSSIKNGWSAATAEARAEAAEAKLAERGEAVVALIKALERVRDHPESVNTSRHSYGVGYAFHSVQGIAKTALKQHAAALTAPPAAISEGWMKMETAPKDGTQVLLHKQVEPQTYVAAWVPSETMGPVWCTPDAHVIFGASHWRPLPAPPNGGEGER